MLNTLNKIGSPKLPQTRVGKYILGTAVAANMVLSGCAYHPVSPRGDGGYYPVVSGPNGEYYDRRTGRVTTRPQDYDRQGNLKYHAGMTETQYLEAQNNDIEYTIADAENDFEAKCIEDGTEQVVKKWSKAYQTRLNLIQKSGLDPRNTEAARRHAEDDSNAQLNQEIDGIYDKDGNLTQQGIVQACEVAACEHGYKLKLEPHIIPGKWWGETNLCEN